VIFSSQQKTVASVRAGAVLEVMENKALTAPETLGAF
jgi:hypothetical protein